MILALNRPQLLNGSKSRLILSCLLFIILLSCKGKEENSSFEMRGEVFRTSYLIKYHQDKIKKDLRDEIQACLDSFNLSLNPFNEKSIIYKVNNNMDVEVDDWFITVFNKAQEVSRISEGAYDITCAPLINLWGFGFENIENVNQNVIDSLKQFIGYNKVRLQGRKVIKEDPRLQLNASSIAKGYACDVIAQLLDSHGIINYMIEIGGEIHAKGHNSKGEYWKVIISKPIDDYTGATNELQEIISLKNTSLATSGNYRNYYIKEGKKYTHTINPLTGYPSEGNILSASVIYPNCMTADAYATVFMVLGLEKACFIADRIPQMDYLFIYSDKDGNFQEKKSLHFEKHLP